MLVMPLYILLIFYIIFLLIFLLFSAINMYHIFASASFTYPSFMMTVLVATLTIITLYITSIILQDIDWFSKVTLFDISWLPGVFIK